MSIHSETVETRRCDFCIAKTPARQCQKCGKDACSNCGRIYSVVPDYWSDSPFTVVMGTKTPMVSAVLCHDCGDELKTALLRLGFDNFTAARSA